MKQVLLTALIAITALSTVACGDKKASQKDKVHACMWDQTGNCQRQVAAYMAAPPIAGAATGLPPSQIPVLVGSGIAPIGTTPQPGAPAVISPVVKSVAAAVKAQQLKVQSALEADSQNPNSLHYDPPQAARSPASVSPASVAPQSAQEPLPPIGSNISGDSEVIR